MTRDEFERMYNGWDLNQRIQWEHFSAGLAGNPPPTAARIDQITRDFVRSHYGAMASYLDHPEVGPLLMAAAREGWTETTFNARLGETTWYKSTNASQRQWDLLSRSDPASANQQRDQMASQIKTLLTQQGVEGQFSDARINELATQFLRNGMPTNQIPQAVIMEAAYSPTAPIGKLGDRMSQVSTLADQYAIPIGDEIRFDWAKKIEAGLETEEGLQEYLRQTAKAQYGTNASITEGIDRGFTVKQLVDPQIQTAAQLLEIDPDTIQLLDPRFSNILQFNDPSGTTRLATLGETQKLVKGTAEYRQTTGANNQAADLAQMLASTFGKA